MISQIDELLQNIDLSAGFLSLISTCDRLREEGNLPGLNAQLGSHYSNVRLALLIVDQLVSSKDEARRISADLAASLDHGSDRYLELILYEQFYKTGCGVHAIGAWCGFPYATEENLQRVHKDIVRLKGAPDEAA